MFPCSVSPLVWHRLLLGLSVGCLLVLGACQRHEAAETATPPPGVDWQSRTVAGLTMEAPANFVRGKDVTESAPVAVREMILFTETYLAAIPRPELKLMVVQVQYQPDVPLSLDGAARETVNSAAAAIGDSHPVFDISPTQVSGVNARRVTYQHKVVGGTMHLDVVLIVRGQQLWQVQTYYTAGDQSTTVNRILASVEIAPEAAPAP